MSLLDVFSPYLLFISFFVTMIVNIWLIYSKVNWYSIIIMNIILSLIMNFIGLGPYDFLTQTLLQIGDILVDLFTGLFKAFGDALKGLFNPFN